MTTYTIQGFKVVRNLADDVTSVVRATLDIVLSPTSNGTASYRVLAPGTPTEPLPEVDITIDGAQDIRIDGGVDLQDQDTSYFGFLNTTIGTSYVLNLTYRPIGVGATDWIFVLGGHHCRI